MADQERRPRRTGSARYGRYAGGPDPLAPPVDLGEALADIADDVMAGYSPEQALREHLRRGGRSGQGLDRLAGAVRRRREDLLSRHRLGAPLEQARELLDRAVLAGRGQLARDTTMDPTDRAFREMQIADLPDSTPAAVTQLADYDWASAEGRELYRQIQELLGRDMLDARFQGMKQMLENATDADRAEIEEMLADLNTLLEKHARGEDGPEDFWEFMAKHGQHFPEQPEDVDELIEILAARSAAAQRMLRGMSAEQRAELMALSQQAFGSPALMDQLARMDAALEQLRPDLDWDGGEDVDLDGLTGQGPLGDLAELDALAAQLGQDYPGASLGDLDLDALARQLGAEAAADAATLTRLERALRDSELLRRGSDGDLRLSPVAMRRLGASLLQEAATRLASRSGRRDARLAGAGGEPSGASRDWAFGDTEPWDVTGTMTRAITRTAAEGGDPAADLRLRIEDVQVQETEARTRSAVALLVDTSFSMVLEDRWTPMKRTALALHHLLSTRFRGDELAVIGFGQYAQRLDIAELTALPPRHEQGTNLQHALMLAHRFLRRNPDRQPVVLVVTDGEPTAHLLPGGQAFFDWPSDPRTIALTVAELDKVAALGARTTFFRLGEDPDLARFLESLARRVDGRVVAPEADDLGAAVVGEYLRRRPRGRGAA